MTNIYSTKRAFLTSLMALLLCFTMMLGTTFAWFTDSVTSEGNKIQAGTLKIDLALFDKDTGTFESIKESKDPIFDYANWEPGYTEVKLLKVENLGSLALKWKATLTAPQGLSDLANVIDVFVRPYGVVADTDVATTVTLPADRDLTGYTKVGTVASFVSTIEDSTVGTLKADEAAYLGIALKMQESAGNEYQGEDGMNSMVFDIQILATQLNNEFDSFDENYDQTADFGGEVSNASALVAALTNGGSYKAMTDIDASGETLVSADNTKLDLDGKTLAVDNLTSEGAASFSNGTLSMPADGRVYASEAGEAVSLEKVVIVSDDLSVLAKAGGTVTLKDVTIQNTTTSNPIQNYGGNLTLDDVTATQEGDAATAWYSSAIQVVNQIVLDETTNKYRIVSQANTTIEGGTYTGKKALMISAPGGNVTINGGTFVGSEQVIQDDFAPQNYLDGNLYTSIITINGGSFTGNIKVSAATELIIKGGSFSVNPSAYVPAGFVATENGGIWTVAAA